MPKIPSPTEPASGPLDAFHAKLLGEIARTGSITQAAAECGVSYRTAWSHVDRINALSEHPLVARETGGARGGGTRLTEYGAAVLKAYAVFRREQERHLRKLRERAGADPYVRFARRLSLRTSARNQFYARVIAVRKGALDAEVTLRLKGGDTLVSRITRRSVDELGIRKGGEVFALVKANWVKKIPVPRKARENAWKAVVEEARRAGNRMEIGARLPGGEMLWISGVTSSDLRPGAALGLGIEASHVILGVN